MNQWLVPVLIAAAGCAVMYLLYSRGVVITKSICAVLFVLRSKREMDSVTLDACSGWVRHMIRFGQSGTYEFTLDAQLSRGDAEVFLLDKHKQQLLALNRSLPVGRADLDQRSRYYLCWRFQCAAGKCQSRWQICADI